jgi:hypothetical protein
MMRYLPLVCACIVISITVTLFVLLATLPIATTKASINLIPAVYDMPDSVRCYVYDVGSKGNAMSCLQVIK